MRLLEFLASLATFPVKWFWKKRDENEENKKFPKQTLLFLVSMSGILFITFAVVMVTKYMLAHHLNLVVASGFIFWLYVFIRDRKDKPEENSAPAVPSDTMVQAENGYPVMRNIIFQTAKASAPDIGGRVPRLLGEIEMPESRYILRDSLCFYQFRLMKEDIRTQYNENDLEEFKAVFQADLSHKIESGAFPSIKLKKFQDDSGNFHDGVVIDTIEDVGNILILHAVFPSDEYARYRREIDTAEDALPSGGKGISETWKKKP